MQEHSHISNVGEVEQRICNARKTVCEGPLLKCQFGLKYLRNLLEVGEVAPVDMGAYAKRAGQIIARSM